MSFSLPVAVLTPTALAVLQETQSDRFGAPPWADDGSNLGRTLCCLYSTLLC
jgi:hypothetical protein